MVMRLIGVLGLLGLVFGFAGCASQQVSLVGEWVYQNPAGEGVARISIDDDGMFEITDWPINLRHFEDDPWYVPEESELDWEETLSFFGKLDELSAGYGDKVRFDSGSGEKYIDVAADLREVKNCMFCETVGARLVFPMSDNYDEGAAVSFVREGD